MDCQNVIQTVFQRQFMDYFNTLANNIQTQPELVVDIES